jgi:hypothetical protein
MGGIWNGLHLVISQHNADVIVGRTRGERGLQKLLMGLVTEESCLIPVLAVLADAAQSGPHNGLRTVLYPTNPRQN